MKSNGSERAKQPAPKSYGQDLVIRTSLIPPQTKPQVIMRQRINQLLSKITYFPLTLLKAEAGYGKTTALAYFFNNSKLPYFWYRLGDTETDPLIFLLHIIYAFRASFEGIGERALAYLSQEGGAVSHWTSAVDSLANDLLDVLSMETVLVLDDYHVADKSEINAISERLIEHMPPRLHIAITSRTMPSLPNRARLRASGELLEISRSDLAFTTDEVKLLFAQRFDHEITHEDAYALATETEGWPIALQMLSEGIKEYGPNTFEKLLRRIPGSSELLFNYLAEEVFLDQPKYIQTFLAETATLRRLDPEICNYLLDRNDSEDILRLLEENSLFVTREGSYRYHHLFRDFLRKRIHIASEHRKALDGRSASYYRSHGDIEEAVHHLLSAEDFASAANLLSTISRPMAYSGRHHVLANWLDKLPSETLDAHPELLLARGHAYRFSSQYKKALIAYARAEKRFGSLGRTIGEVRALRGQALVYLDTVYPARAQPLLTKALQKLGRGEKRERAILLILLAENKTNSGNLRQAERLHHAVYNAAHINDLQPMDPRIYVRDGRFALARQMFESELRTDPWGSGQLRAPRSHRETTALLSWISAMTGEPENARRYAAQSLELGRTLGSPIVECISLARLGISWLTGTDFNIHKARDYYQESILLAERMDVQRFRVEALSGFIIIAGLEGEIIEAKASADQALTILEEAGDQYMSGVIHLALGAAMTICNRKEAAEEIKISRNIGIKCEDRYIPCLANLWLAIYGKRFGQLETSKEALQEALRLSEKHGFDFIFSSVTPLGPKDFASRMNLLESVRLDSPLGTYAARLRESISPPVPSTNPIPFSITNPELAPFYIQTLGPFRVRRQGQEVERRSWEREKALHLLQFLICNRGHLVHREQIFEALWRDTQISAASTGLRVALMTLRKALNVNNEAYDFIRREGECLTIDMNEGVFVDADEFQSLIRLAGSFEQNDPERAISLYESALPLYKGDFLEDNPYAEWADEERNKLITSYLSGAEHLARLWLIKKDYERANDWANAIINKDPLWEEGYILQMQCYWKLEKRALAVRVYDRCRKKLHDALDLDPSPRAQEILHKITKR